MTKHRKRTKTTKEDPSITNAKILKAEKHSILIAIPVGLISGLITHFTTSNFIIINTLVIGIGAFVTTAMLLFHYHFGKNLPKRIISSEEYGSPLSFHKSSSSDSLGTRAYNYSNGNPSSSCILPSRRH